MALINKRRRDYHGLTYHAAPERKRKQERGERWRKFINRAYAVIILGTLIWLVYFILYSPTFKITDIHVIGNQEIRDNEVKSKIYEIIRQKKYFLIPRDNYFTFPKEEISEKLRNDFVLADSKITKKFPRGMTVNLKEKLSTLNLCLEEPEKKCYLINYQGLATSRITETEIESKLPLLYFKLSPPSKKIPIGETASSSLGLAATSSTPSTSSLAEKIEPPKIAVNQSKIPEDTTRFILNLFEIFNQRANGVKLKNFEVNSFEPYDKKVIINTETGYQIYFNKEADIQKQINDLNLILIKKIKGEASRLEYIDLRYDDQIYYKYK